MYYENEIVNLSHILIFSGPDLSLYSSGRSCALGTEVWLGFFIFHDATFGSAVLLLAGEWHTAGASPGLCILTPPALQECLWDINRILCPAQHWQGLFAALPSEVCSGSLSCGCLETLFG